MTHRISPLCGTRRLLRLPFVLPEPGARLAPGDEKDTAMLELRPTCEHCDMALPPASTEARICSFECTFCASCVQALLGNVCPN